MDQWKELDHFPKEILEHIISYMDNDVKLNMRLASTKWFKLVNYRTFTIKFPTENMLPHIVDRMLQYNGAIGLKFGKSKIKKVESYIAHLSRLTNLTSLTLPYINERDVKPEVWWGFTSLTNLQQWEVPYGCPASVTASLINMRELRLEDSNLDVLTESMKKMSYLEYIECHPDIDRPLDLSSLLPCPTRLTYLATNGKLDHSSASKLCNLKAIYYGAYHQHVPLQLAFDKFTALTSLDISQPRLSFGALPTSLIALTMNGDSLDTACHQHLAAMHKVKELNINTLYLSDEQYSWIGHLTSLEAVSIWPTDKDVVEPFTGAMYGMIKSSKLTELVIQVTPHVDLGHLSCLTTLVDVFFYEDAREGVIDYSFASHLTRLTSFTVYQVGVRPSLTALANLENLKYLRASGSNLGHVYQIEMSLERLTGLEHLHFDTCDGDVFESLSALTHLTFLRTASLPVINYEFLKAVPLREINLMQDVHEHFYTVMVQLTGLQSLTIRGLSAEQVIGLSALQHLTLLNATDCDMGKGQHVTRLTSLQMLYVSAQDMDSALIESSLPNLINFRSW